VRLPNGEAAPEHCEFRFVFDPPLSPFDEQRVEVLETWSGKALPNGRLVLPQPLPSPIDKKDGLTPVILTSTGRTATTLLMSEFARHPEMVVADRYPYETKHIAYYSAAFRALVAEADRERSTHPETMLAPEKSQVIGSNPYNDPGLFSVAGSEDLLRDFYGLAVPSAYAGMFRDFILKFYSILARSQGKQAAPFFCEKGDLDEAARRSARLFFGAVKEIVVIRDPRDLLCSAIAFWKLPPQEALAMLRMTVSRLARIVRNAGPDTLVVRYEDLLLDPTGSRLAMSNFIGLEQPLQPTDEAGVLFERHGTSDGPSGSIGRWKRDLGPEWIAACDATFEYFMRDHGYPASDAATWHTKTFESSRTRQDCDVIVAQGREEVVAFLADLAEEDDGHRTVKQLLALTFGRGDNGTGFLRKGWSAPEGGYVWTNASESYLRLPAIRQNGEYCVYVVGDPFTFGTRLSAQHVTVCIDGQSICAARVRDSSVIAVPVPAAVAAAGQPMTLMLRLQDAARPIDIGGANDTRLLAFALRRIILCRIAATSDPAVERIIPEGTAANDLGEYSSAQDADIES
jgi:hypothetical protein